MNNSSKSLILTSEYYKLILDKVHESFLTKHNLKTLPKTFQLYGYGAYNEVIPSLKRDFEEIGSEVINGKYLYDKSRQLDKGKPLIKINQYYKSILLIYIGFENFKDFIDAYPLSPEQTEQQISLLYNKKSNKTFYYISYYYGEDNRLLKGQTVISENFNKIKHTYGYPMDDGTIMVSHSFGNISKREDTLHIHTKTLIDGKYVAGGSEIYYIGLDEPSNSKFLIGTYCTFDFYTQTVAGKSILEQCDTKEEMEVHSKDTSIPAYIAQEIRKSRIINPSVVPKHQLELSEKSPYASIYAMIPGKYELMFELRDGYKEILKFEIARNTFQLKALTENIYLENENFQLINKGSVLHFSFKLAGIIALDTVDIYLKTYFLKETGKNVQGVFSGVDNENRLVNGNVLFTYSN